MTGRLIDADAVELRAEKFERFTGTRLDIVHDFVSSAPTVDAIPVEWIKEWKEEIKDHPAYTEEEKTLCIEEFEDMLGAWAERKEE